MGFAIALYLSAISPSPYQLLWYTGVNGAEMGICELFLKSISGEMDGSSITAYSRKK